MTRAIHQRREPVEAVIRPPGSKSITNRALITSTLARGGVSRLHGPLEADDTRAMREGLTAFGVSIDDSDDPWLVLGTGGQLDLPTEPIDALESGTTARFLAPLGALVNGMVTITGGGRLPQRPFGDLAQALDRIGVTAVSEAGGLPLQITGTGAFPGGRIEIDPSRSSQFVSALMMVGPVGTGVTELVLTAAPTSTPYLQTTIDVMAAFGAQVIETEQGFLIPNGGYRSAHFEIEADASAAAYPLVAAAITGGVVVVDGIRAASRQADMRLVEVLAEMGCFVRRGEQRLELRGPENLAPVDVDMASAPDAALALAAACLFATGPSRIRGLHTLRLKESNRLAALATEINRLGAKAREDGDDLVIEPRALHGVQIDSHGDHRIAMSLALVGLRVAGVEIGDPKVVEKTWPRYFEMLERL